MKELLCTWFYNKQLKLLKWIWCKWNVCLDLAKRNTVNNSRGVIGLNIFPGLCGVQTNFFLPIQFCPFLQVTVPYGLQFTSGMNWKINSEAHLKERYVIELKDSVPSSLHGLKGLHQCHLPPLLTMTMKEKSGRRAELKWLPLVPFLQWQKSLPLTSPSSKPNVVRREVKAGHTYTQKAKIWWLWAIILWYRISCTLLTNAQGHL